MKSTLDLEDILYHHLKGGALVTQITGSLVKRDRPINSIKEDVVINSLPVNNLPLSTAVCNVNIHVPNLSIGVNGLGQKVTNTPRLQQLFNLAKVELNDVMIGDSYFDIQQQILFPEEDSSYINIRLDFTSINTSN